MKSRRYLDVLKTVRYLVCGIGAALMVMTVAACGSNDSAENSAPAATETPPPTVKVMLNLMPQVQYIGIHAAEGQGYYQDKDLDVELLYSDPNADIIAAVTTGGAQFGVVSADRVLQARSRGEPVVAVMALYQRDPTAVLSLQTKEIRQASDLNWEEGSVME
jgi:NitT/TauT family transport system substrate-binding protein